MHELHWLPIRQRIAFKVNLLTYQALHGQAPLYIAELITPYTPYKSLDLHHKTSSKLLVVWEKIICRGCV